MSASSSVISSAPAASSAKARVAAHDWRALADELDSYGWAVLPKLLSPEECGAIAALYRDESHFRSHIHTARHGFGKGEYRYFKYPLPDLVDGVGQAGKEARNPLRTRIRQGFTRGTGRGWRIRPPNYPPRIRTDRIPVPPIFDGGRGGKI